MCCPIGHVARSPYLYTDQQIKGLMRETSALRSAHKAATFRTLFGLLLVTGMRIGEAIALDRADFDADLGTLIIRHGLCRIRHRPCYAGACVMPSWPTAACVSAAKRDLGG